MKKIMTLQELRQYFQQKNKDFSFSAKDQRKEICFEIPAELKFSDDTEGLTKVTLLACHDKENLNGSEIDEADMKDALASFKDRPILGFIHIDKAGDPQFAGHEMHENDDGEIIYDEEPMGHTVSEGRLQYDEQRDKNFVRVDGVLYEDYSKACDILRRDEKCDVSVELNVREMSYNAESHLLKLKSFYCHGITILGYDENGNKIKPAMAGSNIKLMNQEGNSNNMKFDELLKKYGKTAEDVKFDYSALSEENLEKKFEEEFGNHAPEIKYSVNGKDFSVSLSDIQMAITNLVNETYSEQDGEYYFCDVYLDDKNVVMHGWTKSYRQSFKVRNDDYSLTGDRVEVKAVYVTADEEKRLEEMKANYSSISDKLAKYEAEPQKMEILNSADYAKIANVEDFKNLYDVKNHFDMSVEDVAAKADAILLDFAKHEKPVLTEPKPTTPKTFSTPKLFPPAPRTKKKNGRYGDFFND